MSGSFSSVRISARLTILRSNYRLAPDRVMVVRTLRVPLHDEDSAESGHTECAFYNCPAPQKDKTPHRRLRQRSRDNRTVAKPVRIAAFSVAAKARRRCGGVLFSGK